LGKIGALSEDILAQLRDNTSSCGLVIKVPQPYHPNSTELVESFSNEA